MNTTMTKPQPKIVKRRTITKFHHVSLLERKALIVDKIVEHWDFYYEVHPIKGTISKNISKKMVDSTVKKMVFKLEEVTADQITQLRHTNVPSFVLKENDKYYYTKIPYHLTFYSSSILGIHKCSFSDRGCTHLSPASDENGGCAKVRNHSIGIELYPWIKSGYESFNTKIAAFIVTSCNHYENFSEKKKHMYVSKDFVDSLAIFLSDDSNRFKNSSNVIKSFC